MDKFKSHAIVGAWLVKCAKAPFQYHVFAFHGDGIMTQSNPEAGNPEKSDSIGIGAWEPLANGRVKAKFVEVSASRATNQFVSRGEIKFRLSVDDSKLTGTSVANFFNEAGQKISGPLDSPVDGVRIKAD